jgi:hypothetical protein
LHRSSLCPHTFHLPSFSASPAIFSPFFFILPSWLI